MRRIKGFTLVELLVVIGIIALLISILLPSLSRARDQANLVVCQSSMRQFYQCWVMYANQNKGKVLPCRYQRHDALINAEFDFFEGQFLGNILHYNSGAGTSGQGRGGDTAMVIKQLLTCRAQGHDGDPNPDAVAAMSANQPTDYYGDYIYNTWMGSRQCLSGTTTDQEDPTKTYPSMVMGKVPANVILLMESRKPNIIDNGNGTWTKVTTIDTGAVANNGYKAYFEKASELWAGGTVSGQPTSALINLRIATPHVKKTKMNVLCADGHIALVDPKKDFFSDKSNQASVLEFMWNAKDNYTTVPPTNSHPGWQRGRPGV